MEVKIEKKNADYSFHLGDNFATDEDHFGDELDDVDYYLPVRVEDALYNMVEVEDVDYRGSNFGVVISGKYDTPETLAKIKQIIIEAMIEAAEILKGDTS